MKEAKTMKIMLCLMHQTHNGLSQGYNVYAKVGKYRFRWNTTYLGYNMKAYLKIIEQKAIYIIVHTVKEKFILHGK